MSNLTTVTLPREVKEHLDKAKIHRREPYYEVIERLLKEKLKEA
jgi:predicted CopG family antitoxin